MKSVVVALCVSLTVVVAACGSSAPAPEAGTAPAAAPAAAPPAPKAPPVLGQVPAPPATITTSSVYMNNPGTGLLKALQAGWHSQSPPKYPEWIEIKFQEPQVFSKMSMLPQDGGVDRSPKKIRVETSDGVTWTPLITLEDACPKTINTWHTYELGKSVETMRVRLMIDSNCGSAIITLRGVKFDQ